MSKTEIVEKREHEHRGTSRQWGERGTRAKECSWQTTRVKLPHPAAQVPETAMARSMVHMRAHCTLLPPIFESLKSLSPLELFYNSPQHFTEFERVSIPCRPKSLMKIVQIKSCLGSEILIICPSTPMLIQPPSPTTPQQGPSTSEISTLLIHRCLAVSPISIHLLTLLPQMHSLLFTLHPPGRLS